MRIINLLALVLLAATNLLFAQTEELKAYRPNGEELTYTVNSSDRVRASVEEYAIKPNLIILNTERVEVHPDAKKSFLKLVESQNEIYQYRYLQQLCEHDLHITKNQALEGQMLLYRKKVHSGNIGSVLLERYLQVKAQKYFNNLTCFAYRLNRTQEMPMRDIAKEFAADWLLSPVLLKVDTLERKKQRLTLQLEVWDSKKDTLAFIKAFQQTGEDLSQSLNSLVAAAGDYVILRMLRHVEFRSTAKLSAQRAAAFKKHLAANTTTKPLVALRSGNYDQGFTGALMNEDNSRFLAFTLRPYDADFEEKIPNKVYRNPYPDLDVGEDMDSLRAHFVGTTYAGFIFNGKSIIKPAQGIWIYTKEAQEAQKIYEAQAAKLGLFKASSAELEQDFWSQGFFTPLDTATLRFQHDTLKVKNWKTQLAVDKLRLAPYQGLPRSVAEELLREYIWKKALDWRVKIAENHLKKLFNELEASRVRDIRFIDTEVRSFQVIHDYDMTRGLVALWVEEPWVKLSLRFFYWDQDNPDELYEWTYLPKVTFDKKSVKTRGKYLYEQMNKVVPWSYVRGFVDDQSFWQDKVLAKEEGKYKYLVKVSEE